MMNEQQIGVAPRKGDFWFSCIDNAVIYDPKLTPIDKTVFCVLCSFASANTREVWPKVSTIAKAAGCSERSVFGSIKRLTDRGIIKKQHRFNDGQQVSSLYTIVGYHAYKDIDIWSADIHPAGDAPLRPAPDAPPALQDLQTELEPKEELEPKDIPPISPKGEERPEPSEGKEQTSPQKAKDNPLEEWFDKFWEHYPKKADKKRAKRTFMHIFSRASPKKQRERMENLILRLTRYVADRTDEDPKYTKNPTTWLNSHDFDETPGEDEILYKPVWKRE